MSGPRRNLRGSGQRQERGTRTPPGARAIALEALQRIDEDDAYANLILPELLRGIEDPRSGYAAVEGREKAFATELTYGTVRMRRACDWIARQHIERDPDAETERVLHLGVYQLVFLKTPAHAALSATVAEAPDWSRGFVNAVLRKVANQLESYSASDTPIPWPNAATELSYPDWIVELVEHDLGVERAHEVLRVMNEPAIVHRRADGYVQDPASQMAASFVGAGEGERILDLCAAPGGKATALASLGASVVAVDRYAHRCELIAENVDRLGLHDYVEIRDLDATELPQEFDDAFDRVLLDAPCSGLGSLRRRPDARWRIQPEDVEDLSRLQRALLESAVRSVRVGGSITYSVCTLTNAESVDHEDWIRDQLPNVTFLPVDAPEGWEPHGHGVRLLPGETDGMCVFRLERNS